MLPERTTQLLTAYIDGELSARQRKQVTRMLQKSAEARRLLKKMRQDSNILRKLPRRKMKIQDLSGSVMGTIAMRGLKLPIPLPSPQRTPRHRIPLWVGLAAAAAVFLVVGIASYFFFASFAKGASGLESDLVENTDPNRDCQKTVNARQPVDVLPPEPPSGIAVVHDFDPQLPSPPDPVPTKAHPHENTFTRLAPPPTSFILAQPRLMMILGIRDLEQTAVTQQVVQELKKDSASRVDLFCTDSVRALDRLQKTFLANGVTLRIDPATRAWLDRRPAARTNLAIYSEELSAEDLGKILQQLAGEDKKAGAQFDKVVVNGVTPAEMAKVLGGDPANYQQPPQKGPLGVDIHKPVEEKTASQLVQALSGQGPSRADLEKERVPNRQAVLIHYPSQAISREVKALVESRKEWRTGAVQVLFILWNNG